MPCTDITEVIEIELDADDRLKNYHFAKRTCGQAVGAASLLLEQLGGRSLDDLLDITMDAFLDEMNIEDELEEFLSLKHMFGIQGALEVLTGKEPGGKDDPFSASEVLYGEDGTHIKGLISIDLVIEKIESCGGCRKCGSASEKAGARRAAREAAQSS